MLVNLGDVCQFPFTYMGYFSIHIRDQSSRVSVYQAARNYLDKLFVQIWRTDSKIIYFALSKEKVAY